MNEPDIDQVVADRRGMAGAFAACAGGRFTRIRLGNNLTGGHSLRHEKPRLVRIWQNELREIEASIRENRKPIHPGIPIYDPATRTESERYLLKHFFRIFLGMVAGRNEFWEFKVRHQLKQLSPNHF